MSDDADDLVWYVAYGSNLLLARLQVYLSGADGNHEFGAHRGSADPSPPRADQLIDLPLPIRFGGRSERWGGGFAWCDPSPGTPAAIGRAWLVTVPQWHAIVAQENRRPETTPVPTPTAGEAAVMAHGFYDRVVSLPPIDGRAAVTLASSTGRPIGPPAPRYVEVMAAGLCEAGMPTAKVEDYLRRVGAVAAGG